MTRNSRAQLLIELGTEELPPKSLALLGESLLDGLCRELDARGIAHKNGTWFASPRRLAACIDKVARRQGNVTTRRLGPGVAAAFDERGAPTQAAEGFARSCGVSVDALRVIDTPKGRRLAFEQVQPGRATAELLEEMLQRVIVDLPIEKRMRWGSGREEFVRPLHWLLVLHGDDVVKARVLGIDSNRFSRGHRSRLGSRHHPGWSIQRPGDYVEKLRDQGHVLVNFKDRRDEIRKQVTVEAHKLNASVEFDTNLLDEVTGLVEWPIALTGHFDSRFLDVPAEALISSMKSHLKYFHVLDSQGNLLPHFIFIANLESKYPERVIAGNERVIRPRLADAAFFYETDCKLSLTERRDSLRGIVFQTELGNLWDKTERVARLAEYCAGEFGADPSVCRRAAELSKSDLVSEMVLEFAELQGIMGRYYAVNDGETVEVAQAIEEHYLPRFAGDRLPRTRAGTCLSVCDRLDTLVGLFGIGQPPSGSKDPFALRRAALGVMRVLIEREIAVDLKPLIAFAMDGYPDALLQKKTLVEEVIAYLFERLKALYQERGYTIESFQAVAAREISAPLDFDRRVRAVEKFSAFAESESLAIANKRVANILAQAPDISSAEVTETLLVEPEERELADIVRDKRETLLPLIAHADYAEALTSLAQLRTPVDQFFKEVLVNTDDEAIRRNRMALLGQLRRLFLEVADISLLTGRRTA